MSQHAVELVPSANKVPRVTVNFRIIKVMATTVGETAADFLATKLNLGLIATAYHHERDIFGGASFSSAQRRISRPSTGWWSS